MMPKKKMMLVCAVFGGLFLIALLFTLHAWNNEKSLGDAAGLPVVPDSELYVMDFQPGGILPSSVKYPSVYVQFSQPVVPLAVLGEPSGTSEYMRIEPPLKGVYRWYGTSLLCFDSAEAVIPQRDYVVTVSNKITSTEGERISGRLVYSFSTEELALQSIIPGYATIQDGGWVNSDNAVPEEARSIALYFSYPVQLKEILPSVSVTAYPEGAAETGAENAADAEDEADAGGANADVGGEGYNAEEVRVVPLPFTATQPDKDTPQMILLRLNEAPPDNADVVVSLAKGARAEPDAKATTSEQSLSFHTLRETFLRSVRATEYLSEQYANPVDIRFSQRLDESMDLARVAAAVRTNPPMPVTAENLAVRGTALILHSLPVTFEQTYTFAVDAGVIRDAYGRMYEKAIGPETITVPRARSFARFKDSGLRILENQFEPKLAFEFQNILPGSHFSLNALDGKNGSASAEGADTRVVLKDADIPANTRVLYGVDLRPYLTERNGRYTGAVEFNASMNYMFRNWEGELEPYTQRNSQVIQVTDLGVSVRYGFNKALAMVTKLSTGEPVEGAQVSVFPWNRSEQNLEDALGMRENPFATGRTDADGFVVIPISSDRLPSETDALCFRAEADGDSVAFMVRDVLWTAEDWRSFREADAAAEVSFLFTDRGLYKPGENLKLRGIDRTLRLGKYEPYVGGYTLSLEEDAWKAETIASVSGTTSHSGGFDASFDLPDSLSPGNYRVRYRRNDSAQYTDVPFSVAYFERLRFSTSAAIPDLVYLSGDRISADVSASYLGGGSLAGASWSGNWYREPAGFRAQGSEYEGFAFAPQQGYDGRSALSGEEGALGASGGASSSQQTGGEKIQGKPYLYRFEATVSDSGGQAISASASALVHPAQYYLGVSAPKNTRGFPKKNEKLDFDFVAVTPLSAAADSESFPADSKSRVIQVELLREEWKKVQQVGVSGDLITRYVREMVEEQSLSVPLGGRGAFAVTPPKGGAYLLRLSSEDSRGRRVITERSFYVSGSDWSYYYADSASEIRLIPDKELYDVGDTAQIILQSPLPAGRYMMTVEREGIFSEEIFVLNEPTTVLELPVTDRYLPVVYVTVSSYSVRTGAPSHSFSSRDMDKPKGYFGATAIHVNPDVREFDVLVEQDKPSYRPGDTATFTLTATKAGQPLAGAEITLMAVDRGVLDLIGYHVPDPIAYFYHPRLFPNCVHGGDSRSFLMDPVTYEVRNLYGGDEGGDKLNERKNFDPTAIFLPALRTGADGKATCSFTVPDTLTEYRITTVGVLGEYFSLGEDAMVVNNPLSVRDVLPRRLRVGDVSDVGVVISNMEENPAQVFVRMELFAGSESEAEKAAANGAAVADGSAAVVGSAERTVTVPPGKTVPLFFDMKALTEGFVTVRFTVRADTLNERITKPLEIERPVLYETVTTVGDVFSGNTEERGSASVRENIVLPFVESDGADASLFVCLDPTRLGTLTEAVGYVFRYPYGCLEQRCSAMLPLAYFGEYIDVFGLNSEVREPDLLIESEMQSWANAQKSDGGFPYWRTSSYSSLASSLRFAELVAAAREKGLRVPEEIDVSALREYLLAQFDDDWNSNYVCAYILFVAQKLGANITDEQIDSVFNLEGNGVSEKALCGLMYLRNGNRNRAALVAQTLRALCRPTTRGVDISDEAFGRPWLFLNNKMEAQAFALQFFSQYDSGDDLNGRLVFNLLQAQRASHGYWENTATTARVLEAMHVYIKANNLESLDFTGTAELNDTELLRDDFRGLGARPAEKTYSVRELLDSGIAAGEAVPLVLSKDGIGSMFYTLSLKYPLPYEEQKPRDEGLCVFVDVTDVETGARIADNQLTAGKIYRAKVTVSTTRDRTFVALRTMIPSGAEVLNAAFATTQQFVAASDSDGDDGYNYGLSSQEIYDNEVRYFWDYFPKGSQQVEFLFRTVRKGSFGVPSSLAECMYEPEIFGRSKGGVFVISE